MSKSSTARGASALTAVPITIWSWPLLFPRLDYPLFETTPARPPLPVNKMTFDCSRSNAADRSNAKEMYHRLITAPCPSGIFITAAINWRKNKTAPFFGGTHTAPTPVAHTMQQLGLAVTRGFGLLLWQGSKQMGINPQKYTDQAENRLPDVELPSPVLPIITENQRDTLV